MFIIWSISPPSLPDHKWKLNVHLTIIEMVSQADSQTVSRQTILLSCEL